jgi:hypothetical protein
MPVLSEEQCYMIIYGVENLLVVKHYSGRRWPIQDVLYIMAYKILKRREMLND